MSKNVAVFVDVANIFYAAKAAGVDIDYVTLLKSATAGRDFVRAYAYTGLDPENENQRQFHSFLARSGYKVISKDIRKYGDGRIKANLDIELVVDMMKTARNLDIAVVVSGDGDFAPAIRAVQEMGVRCEVISFRGNTSSDLIEVADQFTDIAQIARVDKSNRSGRRVAAEGDLSMTEVPEKETEGAPRRRRGSGAGRGREERLPVVAEASAQEANLIVLPGERLSRAGEGEGETEIDLPEVGDAEEFAESANGSEPLGEDGRRRRRRRGGRGRGRGRREDGETLVASGEPTAFGATPNVDADIDEDEEFEDLPPTTVPSHAFGSVWDSQLGVPTSSSALPPSVELGGESSVEDDYDEPEVPEYLLAERRQRGQQQRPGGRGRPAGGGRNRAAYQVALDRERFGRSTPQPTFGGGGGGPNRQQPDRGRDRGRPSQGRPPQGGRPVDRGPRMSDRQPVEARSSSEPWSEVPPELEEMLRAEMARKQPMQSMSPTSSFDDVPTTAPDAALVDEAPAAEATAKPKRTTRPRTTKSATPAPEAASETPSVKAAAADSSATAAEAPAKPKRTTRARTTKATASEPTPDGVAQAAASDASAGEQAAPEEPKKPTRRRTTKPAAGAPEEG